MSCRWLILVHGVHTVSITYIFRWAQTRRVALADGTERTPRLRS